MPPGRRGRPAGSTNRTSTAATASGRTPQQRLSFTPNATNKITKASAGLSGDKKEGKGKLSPKAKKALEDEVDGITTTATTTTTTTGRSKSHSPVGIDEEEGKGLPIRGNEKKVEQQQQQQKPKPGRRVEVEGEEEEEARDEKEVLALKISEAQIRRFWAQKEEGRIVGRVHQQGMGVHEKVLREWDLSSQFGSCIGISRTKRWKRADRLGLRPPLEVLAVLLKEEENEKKGGGEAKNGGVQIAYMDKLMGGKAEEVSG